MTAKKTPNEPLDGREKILEAALKEFAEKRYTAASVQPIADAAGVTKGLIYHHFGSKRQLYLVTVERAVDRIVNSVTYPIPEGDLFEMLYEYSHRKLTYYLKHPYEYKVVYDILQHPRSELFSEISTSSQEATVEIFAIMVERAAKLPLKDGVSPEDLITMIDDVAGLLVKKFTDRYSNDDDRGLSHIQEFEKDFPRVMGYLCYGMLTA